MFVIDYSIINVINIIIIIQIAFIPSLSDLIVIVLRYKNHNYRNEKRKQLLRWTNRCDDVGSYTPKTRRWRDTTSLKVNSVKYTAGYPGLRGDLTVARRWKPFVCRE